MRQATYPPLKHLIAERYLKFHLDRSGAGLQCDVRQWDDLFAWSRRRLVRGWVEAAWVWV